MTTVKQGLYPPGGFFFTEKDGSVQKGRSWMDVIRKVRRYRSINKFEIGDPMAEVIAQAAKRWPDGFYENFPARNVNVYASRRAK